MKKRILSALLAAFIGVMSIGAVSVAAETGDLILSDTTKVNVENTDTCFAKATGDEYHTDSNYYMHFKSEGDWLEVAQNLTETATAGSQYILTVVAKPISGRVWFRIGWDDTAWMVVEQSDSVENLGDGWYKYVKEITMTADQTNILFHNDAGFGTAEFYIDSMSLKPAGEDKELVPNSGFDSVSYDPATEKTTANQTTVNVENTDKLFAKVIGEALDAENEYSLHFKAGGNDWLEVTQNLTATAKAGEKYVFTAYVKPVTGKVWFYMDWDATGWMATHAADVIAPQPDGWTMIQKTITMTEDKTKLLFHNEGETEMYVDDISLVPVGGTENLIPDGGFGEVTVDGGEEPPVVDPDEPTENIPDENLTLSDTTHVNVENTDTCFAKVTDDTKSEGSYSLHFKAGSEWLEVDQTLTEGVTAGGKYILSASVKVVSGKVWFRIGWDDTGWLVSNQTDLGTDIGNGWVRFVKEVTLTGDQTKLLFHNDGATEMYIDDLSLVAVGGTENLVPDGGFEEVTVADQEEDIPDENLTLSSTTTVNTDAENCYARVTDDEKNSGSYSMHLYTAGDWIEVSQRLTENALTGETYIFSAYVKPVTGRVWFRLGWDNDAWMAADSSLGTEWVKVQKEVTVAGNEGDLNTVLFHGDGAAEFYIDDISLVKVGETTERVPDGGFEEVTVFADIPDEKLVLSNTTTVNGENTETKFAKVTDNEKSEGKYSLHIKAGADDWLEVSQKLTENAVMGETYILSVSVKPVSGKVWFRLGWDDTAWLVSTQTDLGTELENGWIRIVKEISLTGNDGEELNTILFHNDGAAEMYIDDISLVKVGETAERVPDGGFEQVKMTACDGEHVWDEGVITTPATHTEEGVKTISCTVCVATKTETVEKTLDHEWGEGVVTVEPTVDAEGVRTYTCICGEIKTETIDKLPAPSYVTGDANGDNAVDVKDVIQIRRSIAGGYNVEVNKDASDVNNDNAVDVKDVIQIRRFITGGYNVELK